MQVVQLLMHGQKQCWRKEAEKAKEYCIVKRLGMGCFTKKVKSSLRYDFALKPECQEDPVLLSDCLYNQ